MKRSKGVLAALLLAAVLLCFTVPPLGVHAAETSAGEAVIEIESGRVLHARHAEKRLPMASTTKILTALLIIEDCDLEEVISVPQEAAGTEGSSVYLTAGERVRVIDLLYGLMLRSGNDCAVALALHHSGSVPAFAERMNERAKEIGAENSRFANPHGLPAEGHYTTALDLARIAAYALHNETFRAVVSAKEWQTEGEQTVRVFRNKNKMLYGYEGAEGVKTGYTKEAGRCLVTAAERGGMHLVCVTLNSPQMYERSTELLDSCFAEYRYTRLFDGEGFCVRVPAGYRGKTCRCGCPASFSYPLAERERAHVRIEKTLQPRLRLPVKVGDAAGELRIYLKNQLLFSQKIVSIEKIEKSFSDILYEIAKNGRGKACASTNFLLPAAWQAAAAAIN